MLKETLAVLSIYFSGMFIESLIAFAVAFGIVYLVKSKLITKEKMELNKLLKPFIKAFLVYYVLNVAYNIMIVNVGGFPRFVILGHQIIMLVFTSVWFLTNNKTNQY